MRMRRFRLSTQDERSRLHAERASKAERRARASAQLPDFFWGGGDFISIYSGGLTATSAFRGLPPEWSVCGLQSPQGVGSLLFLPLEKCQICLKAAYRIRLRFLFKAPPGKGCLIEIPQKNTNGVGPSTTYDNQS